MKNLVKGKFEFDCIDGEFEGLHNPRARWNGWACPYMTADTIRQLTGIFEPHADDPTDYIVDEQNRPFYIDYEGLREPLEPIDIDGETYYDVSCGMCWMVADE